MRGKQVLFYCLVGASCSLLFRAIAVVLVRLNQGVAPGDAYMVRYPIEELLLVLAVGCLSGLLGGTAKNFLIAAGMSAGGGLLLTIWPSWRDAVMFEQTRSEVTITFVSSVGVWVAISCCAGTLTLAIKKWIQDRTPTGKESP